MQNDNEEGNKISMTKSVFIALCVVSVFCAISIMIVEKVDGVASMSKAKRLHLPHTKDYTDLVL